MIAFLRVMCASQGCFTEASIDYSMVGGGGNCRVVAYAIVNCTPLLMGIKEVESDKASSHFKDLTKVFAKPQNGEGVRRSTSFVDVEVTWQGVRSKEHRAATASVGDGIETYREQDPELYLWAFEVYPRVREFLHSLYPESDVWDYF